MSSETPDLTSAYSPETYKQTILSSHNFDKQSYPDTPKKRSNVSHACQNCRHKRVKCDGEQPCKTCDRQGSECIYALTDWRRLDDRYEHQRKLEERIYHLEARFSILKDGTDEQAFNAFNDLRGGQVQRAIFQPTNYLPPPDSLRLAPDHIHYVGTDTNARPRLCQSDSRYVAMIASTCAYNNTKLPPKDVICQGARNFFEVIAGLCYVISADEFGMLCNRVYDSRTPDILDVVELCAIASVGTHYLDRVKRVSDHIKDALFNTVVQHLNDMMEVSSIRSIRILICICLYGIVEKRRSTRALLHTALQMSRWSLETGHKQDPDWQVRAKLYRTTIFVECWLATSLGYQPGFLENETGNVLKLSNIDLDWTMNNATQQKMTEISLLKVKILTVVYRPEVPTTEAIDANMQYLEQWYATLPEHMTLQALMSGQSASLTEAQCGALFLGHAMYLGTIILLHHRNLVIFLDSIKVPRSRLSDESSSLAQQYRERCIDAARSISRIFILLGFGTEECSMHFRCWLSVFEIFTSVVVMLCGIVVDIVSHVANEEAVQDDLVRAYKCMLMLESSAKVDRVSTRLHQKMVLMYHSVAAAIQQFGTYSACIACVGDQRMASPLQEICACEALRPLIADIADVLRNPFGHRVSNAPDLLPRDCGAQHPDWWESSTW